MSIGKYKHTMAALEGWSAHCWVGLYHPQKSSPFQKIFVVVVVVAVVVVVVVVVVVAALVNRQLIPLRSV